MAKASTSPLYSSFWLTDTNAFQQAVSCFETIISHFPSPPSHSFIDPSVKQSIASAVTSTVIVAVDAMQAKHEEEIFALREIIKKFLLLRKSPSAIPSPSPVATPKTHPGANFFPKTTTKRWNQSDLGYFDPHLDRAYKEDKIVLAGKEVYYWNVVLFVQRFQSLVIFQGAALVKANIITSLWGSALE